MEMCFGMVEGAPGYEKKIFKKKFHITADNHFSGDKVFEWIGEKGYGCTMTCRRDRLPAEIPSYNLHKKQTDSSKKCKVARFFQPVVAVKKVEACNFNESYQRVHVSFQSTSSCNFATVNALNECSGSKEKRERGRGDNKRIWGIEMNAARRLYLSTYSRIDSTDHLIQNCRIKYRSWKYWHAPALHCMSYGVVVAYDIYCEIAEGKCNNAWKVDKPVDFWTFRDKLSTQMLQYQPRAKKYYGNENFRVNTQIAKSQRATAEARTAGDEGTPSRRRGRPTAAAASGERNNAANLLRNEFEKAKSSRGNNSRLCGDLFKLQKHLDELKCGKRHGGACVVCGETAQTKCMLCGVYLHCLPQRGEHARKQCFFEYHSESFFGLAKADYELAKIRKCDWKYPSSAKKRQNRQLMQEFNTEADGSEEEN